MTVEERLQRLERQNLTVEKELQRLERQNDKLAVGLVVLLVAVVAVGYAVVRGGYLGFAS